MSGVSQEKPVEVFLQFMGKKQLPTKAKGLLPNLWIRKRNLRAHLNGTQPHKQLS